VHKTMLLSSVLVLGVCGLPYGAALRVGVDNEKMMKTNLTSAGDELYTFDASISTGSMEGALWTASYQEDAIMEIQYKGDRAGWGSVDHAFDVKLPPQWQLSGSGNSYSVIFRDTRESGMGVGKHFYQKFAILPKGESDKKKALFTVRMDSPHFRVDSLFGAKVWKVSRGYCSMFHCYGVGASRRTWREIYCVPTVEVVPEFGVRAIPRSEMPENAMYMWSPEVPYSCSWDLPGAVEKGSESPLVARFADSHVEVGENWGKANSTGAWKYPPSRPGMDTQNKETGLFLTIATALQEAFKLGGSGN